MTHFSEEHTAFPSKNYDPFDGITIVLCEVAVNNMREMNLAMVVQRAGCQATPFTDASNLSARGDRARQPEKQIISPSPHDSIEGFDKILAKIQSLENLLLDFDYFE
jgi:hypothetical protein